MFATERRNARESRLAVGNKFGLNTNVEAGELDPPRANGSVFSSPGVESLPAPTLHRGFTVFALALGFLNSAHTHDEYVRSTFLREHLADAL